jgi:hypothetical protein
MNIVEAFTRLKQDTRLIVEHKASRFIILEGKMYCRINNDSYEHVDFANNVFTFEEILSNQWEVLG